MSTQTVIKNETKVGGWSSYTKPTPAQLDIFNQATKGLLGVKYIPQLVSFQIINGVNYRFKCLASIPPADVVWEAVIEIYAPINGIPYVTGIIRI